MLPVIMPQCHRTSYRVGSSLYLNALENLLDRINALTGNPMPQPM